MALEIYDQETSVEDTWARVMLLGPPRVGKTTSILTTAPGPIFAINCDGRSSLTFPREEGAKFMAVDCETAAHMIEAARLACKLAAEGKIRTVVFDTITIAVDNMQEEFSRRLEGRELWAEILATGMRLIRQLTQVDAHLFVIGHLLQGDYADTVGLVPAIGGQLKAKVPARLNDWVLFDHVPGRNPERQYLLGDQTKWSAAGRNIRRSIALPADVNALFEELGIKP